MTFEVFTEQLTQSSFGRDVELGVWFYAPLEIMLLMEILSKRLKMLLLSELSKQEWYREGELLYRLRIGSPF